MLQCPSRMIRFKKFEFYLLPTLLIVFLINFHYYQFYTGKFKRFNPYVHLNFKINQYETIQNLHPYGPIYQLAQKYRNSDKPVIFIFQKRNDKNFDYTSTYYLNDANPDKKNRKSAYLSELSLYIQYFFYPRVIPVYIAAQYDEMHLAAGSVVIADYDLLYRPTPLRAKQLKRLSYVYIEFNAIDLRKRDSYYAFEVIEPT